ncbi:unnamed protein product [Tuber melanosporum]|uniref:(Perigord truffle) hypothetical protein n=1 Tax=Tuber melanosporum (strain Mel28) TaxID=656061 RepID=D5GIY5_TUBMM|nr:uncharacterized protein GSTUM_00008739001 [Tuber melanosporum]CAZ84478.1 unnamed protein product [Tuber melanosporum]
MPLVQTYGRYEVAYGRLTHLIVSPCRNPIPRPHQTQHDRLVLYGREIPHRARVTRVQRSKPSVLHRRIEAFWESCRFKRFFFLFSLSLSFFAYR